jgi:hypothetical protein
MRDNALWLSLNHLLARHVVLRATCYGLELGRLLLAPRLRTEIHRLTLQCVIIIACQAIVLAHLVMEASQVATRVALHDGLVVLPFMYLT